MPTPPWPLGLPTRLRPVGILGVGASSVVWQVRDTEVGADRAVKVVAAAPGSTVDPARRAETEARALARLAGLAGVVELHEVGRTQDGAAWLVYDLVSGGTLAALGPCSDEELVRVGVRLAVTLVGAHRLEVHHGDISPTNVLIDAGGAPLLADFGMAGLGHAPDDPGGLTPAYAAPERLHGAPPSAASDVWSLAATLAAVAGPGLPARTRSILSCCCAPLPGDRPDAATLADELRGPRSR